MAIEGVKYFFEFTVSAISGNDEEENTGEAKQFKLQWQETETMPTAASARFLLSVIISRGPQAYGDTTACILGRFIFQLIFLWKIPHRDIMNLL